MHPLVQALVWALKAYGLLCLILFAVAVLKLIRTEMAGSERSSYRGAVWVYPLVCAAMAAASWYLARLLA